MDASLADVLRDNRTRHGEVAAYVADGRTITHRELHDRARAIAAALNAHGIRRHDRVAILGRNSIPFGAVLAAGQLSGIVVATVNFRFAAPEIAHVLADSAPRLVFVDTEWLPVVESLCPGLPIVCLDGTGLDEFVSGGGELLDAATPDDVACIIYTSGTTGRPKGCVLGHRELVAGARQLNAEMRTGRGDSVLLVMPLFHIGAMAIGLGVHARGGTAVLHRVYDPELAVQAIRSHGITTLHLAPVLLQQLLAAASGVELPSVRTVVYAAAPMTQAILSRALDAMPDAGFLNLYGQTEAFIGGLARDYHRGLRTAEDARRLASVGHPFPGNEIRIVAPDGTVLPPGEPGEIEVRGPTLFRGYWNNSAATAATLVDGWCRTGDIGVLDEQELLYLVDRKNDVIITGGENVYSVEVEDALSTHPAVVECAVVGVPDETWGETVCAVIVSTSAPELAELQEHVARTLSRYKLPRRLVVVPELPRMPTGKIDKKRIRVDLAD